MAQASQAKAAIMANIGQTDLDDLFQWILENQLDEDVIEQHAKTYDDAKAREETTVQTPEEEKLKFLVYGTRQKYPM